MCERDTAGEKQYEEFYTDRDIIDNDRLRNRGVIKNSNRRDLGQIDESFSRLRALFDSDNGSKAGVVEILHEWRPDFEHIEEGKGLDSKM